MVYMWAVFFFFQAEDGIRDLVRSRGLGDVYKRQGNTNALQIKDSINLQLSDSNYSTGGNWKVCWGPGCLLYTSDAADERSSVDLGGRRIIKKKTRVEHSGRRGTHTHVRINIYVHTHT